MFPVVVVGINRNYFKRVDFFGESSDRINFFKFCSVDFSKSKIWFMHKALNLSNQYI